MRPDKRTEKRQNETNAKRSTASRGMVLALFQTQKQSRMGSRMCGLRDRVAGSDDLSHGNMIDFMCMWVCVCVCFECSQCVLFDCAISWLQIAWSHTSTQILWLVFYASRRRRYEHESFECEKLSYTKFAKRAPTSSEKTAPHRHADMEVTQWSSLGCIPHAKPTYMCTQHCVCRWADAPEAYLVVSGRTHQTRLYLDDRELKIVSDVHSPEKSKIIFIQ